MNRDMIEDKNNSFFRVTLFEDPAYHSLIEKIMSNRSALLKAFEKADIHKNGLLFTMRDVWY